MGKIFKRKIYEDLVKWKKESQGRNALLIEGQRRVGKSTLTEEFGKNEYKSYILINFSNPAPGVIQNFEENFSNLDNFFANLSLQYKTPLFKRDSLIVFDEVQNYPKAREKIKFLVKDGRYDYLETGSLISLHRNVKSILIPSEERKIQMNPMDFEEYLWAREDKVTVPILRHNFENKIPLLESSHRQTLLEFYRYLAIGGMPQVLDEFLRTNSYQAADNIKRDTLNLYLDDINKYSTRSSRIAIQKIFNSVPSELTHHKLFSIGSIIKGKAPSNMGGQLQWLEESKIVNFSYRVSDPNIGMALSSEPNHFRIYFSDTGLMITRILMDNKETGDNIYQRLITGNLTINEGMIIENAVSQALVANGHPLYFTTFRKDKKATTTYEIDFFLVKGKKIIPIEVKSTNNTQHSSLDIFCAKHSKNIGEKYIISPKNLSKEKDIIYLPIYMACLL